MDVITSEEEEGQCSDTEDEGSEEECDPSGLFDALAAAQEAGERYRLQEESNSDETCSSDNTRLPETFLVEAFRLAILPGGGWQDMEEDGESREEDEEEEEGKTVSWQE